MKTRFTNSYLMGHFLPWFSAFLAVLARATPIPLKITLNHDLGLMFYAFIGKLLFHLRINQDSFDFESLV